jgi:F-type H+-transporting ATPase subunit epsilon
MQKTLKLSIVTPNGSIFDGDVSSVILPGIDGEFGIMPEHSSLVTTLDVGVIEIVNTDSKIDAIAINWGHAKVDEASVSIIVDGAVSLNPNDSSDINNNIQEANDLVNSVKNTDVSINNVASKISSYK